MTTSNSKDFELDTAEYVEEAFERCGLQARTGYDLQTARRSLNLLFADWANRGLNRWTISQETLLLASGLAEYPLGTLTLSVAASGAYSLGETITGATSGATASITSLPSATSMAITIPVGTFQNAENVTGATSGAVTATTAVVDLSTVQSSIDVLSAVVRENPGTSTQSDISIGRVSRSDFLNIPSKLTTARPSQFYIDRQITPQIKLWPTPDKTYTLVYDRLVRMDDVDNMVNTPEVPFRFYPCLTAGLAYYISMKKAPERMEMLKLIYEEEFQRAAAEDRDRASLSLTPNSRSYAVI
jgi:predicted anti-sigma-YlaC factor YlaD